SLYCNSQYNQQTDNGKINCATFLAETIRLELQQDHIDKACLQAIKNMKYLDRQLSQQIVTLYKEKEHLRSGDLEKIKSLIVSISQSLKLLKNYIKDEDQLKKMDIEICRKSLMELQNKIREFKRTNDESFQRLSEEESILTDEIMFLESKTDEWNQPINNSVLKPVVKSISKSYISNTDNTRKEILEFQKFLQDHGGHTGGWSEEDHILFLRLRNKSKGKITFLSSLRQHFP
ncbi:hypothetical protein L9F63_024241, partial [Diploptera punctata]